MIVDRYYYSQLNKQEQAIYKTFYNGVMNHQDIIPIPVKGMFSQSAFMKIYSAVTGDNPLIYFLNQSACNLAQDMFGHTAICPQYFFDAKKIKEYNRKIEKVVNGLAGQLQLTEGTDYTYDAVTGLFTTVPGRITVPAATFTQDPTTGVVTTTPGVSVLTVSGTI